MELFLDIETIPTQRIGYANRIDVKPPGNIKKQESIDKWMEENRADYIYNEVAKTALNPGLGEIVSIAWAVNDEEVKSVFRWPDQAEKKLLETFNTMIMNRLEVEPYQHNRKFNVVVGHNVLKFDLAFIQRRLAITGAKLDFYLPFGEKPWSEKVYDTMLKWDDRNFVSLDNLCYYFDIQGKSGMTGKDVYPEFLKGNLDKIAEYNRNDVEIVRKLYKKMKDAIC